MNWIDVIRKTIKYIEDNLLSIENIDEVASDMYISSFYLQKGFKLMTGYSISEYIRNRRLYLSALELMKSEDKIIDVAYKFGYETPESFTKAFSRFHGFTPSKISENVKNIKVFQALKIEIVIRGGNEMNCTIEKKKELKLIGFEREFDMETAYEMIPKFWDEVFQNRMSNLKKNGFVPSDEIEKAKIENSIGEFGVCIEEENKKPKFKYMIAGKYDGGSIPSGMTVFEVPDLDWAVFEAIGPMPGAIQSINTMIFKEWLPNSDYSIAAPINIEWYSNSDMASSDYRSAILIPIKK